MGFGMSRLELDSELYFGGSRKNPMDKTKMDCLDHEVAHLTKLRSAPHGCFSEVGPGKKALPVPTVKMLGARQGNYSGRGRFSGADCCHILSRYLPVNGPWVVDQIKSRVYVSQFSADGSLFVAGAQGSLIKIYNVDEGWKVQKQILAKNLRWTITDTSLSPDQHFLVYASMSPVVHIVNVGTKTTESIANVTEIHDGLDFSADDDYFEIFSVKFSTNGREVVAGTSTDSIYVYDLEAHMPSLRIPAHESDVNTVCFADESGHLIYSGSDDCLCKVWDRRCLTSTGKAAGVMEGHLDGITFIESHGDGRYFISNAKDQTTKLWDIRKMSPRSTWSRRKIDWDYRWDEYPPKAMDLRHPHDRSLATYRGHSVLRTLIRCYFSPSYSTGQKYIYTGSSDCYVYIYDLVSGAEVGKLRHQNIVRDCSWHPTDPILVSSSWDGKIMRWQFTGNDDDPVPSCKKSLRKSRKL